MKKKSHKYYVESPCLTRRDETFQESSDNFHRRQLIRINYRVSCKTLSTLENVPENSLKFTMFTAKFSPLYRVSRKVLHFLGCLVELFLVYRVS